jgi:hypothetical protein
VDAERRKNFNRRLLGIMRKGMEREGYRIPAAAEVHPPEVAVP